MANGEAVGDHLSVGVRLPNGEIQKPISGQHLYWMKPGECAVNLSVSCYWRKEKINIAFKVSSRVANRQHRTSNRVL